MRYYPVNLNIAGRRCLVIGGGQVAERKTKGLLACDAMVTIISPDLSDGLAILKAGGRITWLDRPYRPGDLASAFMVIAATDDEQTQQAVQAEADCENILLNVVDVPDRCSFIVPSILSRGDLTISVSTGGKSPALAKQVREELEGSFDPEYGRYLEFLGSLRAIILKQRLCSSINKDLFQNLLHPEMILWLRDEDWPKIETHLRATLPESVFLAIVHDLKEKFPFSSAETNCP
jgi:precorrin-2 dehydrogenase / sirohydrochlorin ferrochelatase